MKEHIKVMYYPMFPDQTVQLQDDIKRTVKETTLDPASLKVVSQWKKKRPEERLKDLPKTTVNETVNYEHNGIVSGPEGPTDNDRYSRADLKVCNGFEHVGNARGSTYTGNARGSTLQETATDQYDGSRPKSL